MSSGKRGASKTVSRKRLRTLERGAFGGTAATRSRTAISAPFGVLNASKSVPQWLPEESLYQMYAECENIERCTDAGLHIRHNPEKWKQFYCLQSPGVKRGMRVLVQVQTIQTLLHGRYYLPLDETTEDEKAKRVQLSKKNLVAPALATVQYQSDHIYMMLTLPSPNYETVVAVVHGDCLEAAINPPFEIGETGPKEPLVLDMASMSLPGGGWRKGSAAQEENLHRRTNLLHCLEDPYQVNPNRNWDYPIPQYGGIYIPGITVFRGSEADGYPFLETPRTVSIVASAAFKMPPTLTDPRTGEEVLDRKIAKDTLRKIEAILSIALDNGHTFIVLSAFGCGAYANPPGHIARLFKQALDSPTFKGRFSHVIFAIVDSELKSKKADPFDNKQSSPASSSNSHPSNLDIHRDNSAEQGRFTKAHIFASVFGVDLIDLHGHVLYKAGSRDHTWLLHPDPEDKLLSKEARHSVI